MEEWFLAWLITKRRSFDSNLRHQNETQSAGDRVISITVKVEPSTMRPIPRKVVDQAEAEYNVMARVWNALPGEKLIWPQDRFAIKYCYCRVPTSQAPKRGCFVCGFAIRGEYEEKVIHSIPHDMHTYA